jgi:hypothetical protein
LELVEKLVSVGNEFAVVVSAGRIRSELIFSALFAVGVGLGTVVVPAVVSFGRIVVTAEM